MSKYVKIKLAQGEDALLFIDDNEGSWYVLMNENNKMYQDFLSSGQEALDE